MARIRVWLPIITLGCLSLLFFHRLAFTDLILARGDTYDYFYPYWQVRDAALRNGQLPLWNSNIFMGIPLLANPQLGTFYPLNWLTIFQKTPDAVRISILLHIALASIGTFIFFRETNTRSIIPAMVAAMIFGLGGYVSAHVEQINQLQGIAWLPWLLWLYHLSLKHTKQLRFPLALAMIWALQIFSGHTQTVFMTGIALGLYGISQVNETQPVVKQLASNIFQLAIVSAITVILALPQLLPTLELVGMSNRGSGLTTNQATGFSLPPIYIARSLLPSYDGLLFTEYIAYIGVVGMGLALYAMLNLKKQSLIWIVFVVLGIIFAFGRFTPIYLTLAELPGFNLFRVPARWLALYSFGIAMLAGQGLDALSQRERKPYLIMGIVSALVILMALARVLPIDPEDIRGSAIPILISYGLWTIALGVLLLIFVFGRRQISMSIALIAIGVELFLASQIMPYNDLAPRDVYLGQRFTISQMLALTEEETPPARSLSISGRLFNPGDIGTLRERYTNLGLDDTTQEIAFTAIKSQEIVGRNLAMTWGIPSIDGYGGGVLPTIYYSQFTSLMLPDGSLRSTDGRIGEEMADTNCRGACIPDLAWLHLTNTEYLIVDKNFDVNHESIFYDTSLAAYWSQVPARPDFTFDSVHILLSDAPLIDAESFDFLGSTYYLIRTEWESLETLINELGNRVLGVTVVNTRTNTFRQLTPAGFERILSSDIKIYRLDASPRAYLAQDLAYTADDWDGHEEALTILEESPSTTIVHSTRQLADRDTGGSVSIIEYSDTRIDMSVSSGDNQAYLILTDAYYPGWKATVDGFTQPIYRANVMFRAVRVPAGQSEVIFEFEPRLWYGAIFFGGLGWIGVFLLLCWSILRTGD